MHSPLRISLLGAVLASGLLLAALAWPASAAAGHAGERKRPNGIPAPAAEEPPRLGERAARVALGAVGVEYRYGGESPASGFDCSGLVRWAYGRLGVELPHSSYGLAEEGRRVPEDGMRPGDVLLFEGLGHVGLYVGRGRMVHAPQTGRTVEVVALRGSSYARRLVGARRIEPG